MFFVGFNNLVKGQITQRGTATSATTTGTTLTINKPSGLVVGDVMIANIVQSDNDNNTLSNATLSNWILIDGRKIGETGGGGSNQEWWGTLLYKVATATDVAATNFSFILDNDANGDGSVGAIVAFSGVDVSGGIFDVATGTINTSGNTSTVTSTGLTTSTANAAVLMFSMLGNDRNHSNWSTTSPGNLTELYDIPFNTALDNGIGAAWVIKSTAGATGNSTATLSGNARNGAILIALKPCTPPDIPTVTASSGSICSGDNVTLTITGNLNSATQWVVYTGSCGGTQIGTTTTSTFSVNNVTSTTTYYVRGEGSSCDGINCGSVTVTVSAPVPDFDAIITDATCPTSADGSIEITNPIPIQFNDPDYIDIGSNLLSNRNEFTLEGWIKVNLSDIGTRISLFGQNNAIEFGFMSSTSLMCWTASGGSVSADNIYPADNGWHHVAAVGNGTNIIFYIDGTQVSIGGSVTGNYGTDANFTTKIGAGVWDATGGYFPGQMLKVGFWNSALDASQISNLASGYYQYTGSETGLMAGYNFFEGTGTALGSVITGTDGIFNGSPTWTDIYTYSWTKTGEPGFSATTKNLSGVSSGVYNLTVSLGICTSEKSFTVNSTLPAFTTGAIATTGETICSGTIPTTQIGSTTAASGGDNTITYQWQYSADNTFATGVNTVSTNTATYTPTQTLTETTYYRRQARDGTCNTSFTSSTNTWTVTINPVPIITAQPADLELCDGESGSFTVATSATSPSYLWYYSTPADPTNWLAIPNAAGVIEGATTDELQILSADINWSGYNVSCLITANGCETRTSAVLLTVNPLPATGEIIPD